MVIVIIKRLTCKISVLYIAQFANKTFKDISKRALTSRGVASHINDRICAVTCVFDHFLIK